MAKKKSQPGEPKQGLPRLMELAMTKKAPMVSGILLSVLATMASFVPYLNMWRELGINPLNIQERFCGEGKNYVIFADDRFKQLLFLLGSVEMPDKSDTASFMTTGQVEIAKQVMEIITNDLRSKTTNCPSFWITQDQISFFSKRSSS